MAPPCSIRTDALAQELCLHLTDPQNGYAVTSRALDHGYQAVQFQRTGRSAPKDFFTRLLTQGKNDARASAPEIYKKILELAPRQPKLAAFLKGKLEIPWIEATHRSISSDGKNLDAWLERNISSLKNKLEAQGIRPNTLVYNLEMGRGVFEAIVATSSEISPNHGLGLVSDEDLEKPEKAPAEVFRQRKANCLEFTIFYFLAAQKAGIEVVPVASYRDILGEVQDHVMVGFKNPETKKIEKVADIGLKYFGDPNSQEILGEISPLELWAQWFNAQGWKGMDQTRAESYVDQALRMIPGHFLFLYNKGFYRLQAKDYAAAKEFFLSSIRANPNYPPSYHNLYFAASGLGDKTIAAWARKQFYALPENKDKTED